MTSNFPLLRLPFLAFDHVVQVMDPMEQLTLCRTSQKLKSRVRRLTKDFFLRLSIHSKDLFIEFGHGEKMSKIYVDNFPPNEGTALSEDQRKAFENVIQEIQTSFDAKAIVFDNFSDENWLQFKLSNFDFGLLQIGPGERPFLNDKVIKSSSKETLNRLKRSSHVFFETSQSLRMSDKDVSTLTMLHLLVGIDYNFNNTHWNLILKRWASKKVTFKELKLCTNTELITSGPGMLAGLTWVKVEGDEAYPKYQIQRAGGDKAMVYCTNNIFHFYTL